LPVFSAYLFVEQTDLDRSMSDDLDKRSDVIWFSDHLVGSLPYSELPDRLGAPIDSGYRFHLAKPDNYGETYKFSCACATSQYCTAGSDSTALSIMSIRFDPRFR